MEALRPLVIQPSRNIDQAFGAESVTEVFDGMTCFVVADRSRIRQVDSQGGRTVHQGVSG
jgi:hypothetical protein